MPHIGYDFYTIAEQHKNICSQYLRFTIDVHNNVEAWTRVGTYDFDAKQLEAIEKDGATALPEFYSINNGMGFEPIYQIVNIIPPHHAKYAEHIEDGDSGKSTGQDEGTSSSSDAANSDQPRKSAPKNRSAKRSSDVEDSSNAGSDTPSEQSSSDNSSASEVEAHPKKNKRRHARDKRSRKSARDTSESSDDEEQDAVETTKASKKAKRKLHLDTHPINPKRSRHEDDEDDGAPPSQSQRKRIFFSFPLYLNFFLCFFNYMRYNIHPPSILFRTPCLLFSWGTTLKIYLGGIPKPDLIVPDSQESGSQRPQRASSSQGGRHHSTRQRTGYESSSPPSGQKQQVYQPPFASLDSDYDVLFDDVENHVCVTFFLMKKK